MESSVFYVLPNIGETNKMIQNPNLFDYTWFLDVYHIGNIAIPNTKWKRHHIYLDPPNAEIRSEINIVRVEQIATLIEKISSKEINESYERYSDNYYRFIHNLGRNSLLAIILD